MWNRIAATLSFALILWSGPAYGDEGKFTLVPRGGTVSFEATCFDSKATAKLLTWKEFLSEEYKTKCEYEKQALVLDSELIIKNMQITLEETEIRYQVEIDTRDKELETLREIIKKNKKLNIPVVIATSVVTGIAIGVGTAYAIDKAIGE
tara:strand:+ start:386 stop:835 length:450 start_codon:yes stop_codon:yes gene_type:complete